MNFINQLPPFNVADLIGKKLSILGQIDPGLADLEVVEGDLNGLDLSSPGVLGQVLIRVISRNQPKTGRVVGEDWASKEDIEV